MTSEGLVLLVAWAMWLAWVIGLLYAVLRRTAK
jgi:hypothetical protein